MSSEWNDPGASWQRPPNQVHWDEEYEDISSPPAASDEDQDNSAPLSNARTHLPSQNYADEYVDEEDGNRYTANEDGDEDDFPRFESYQI